MKTKQLLTFLGLVFAAGWALQGLAISQGVSGEGRKWLLAAMWAPMLAAVLTGREARRRLWERIRRMGWKFWPIALITGWSFSVGQQLLLWPAHQGSWNGEFFHLGGDGRSIDSVHHLAMVLGVGHQGFGLFALNLLLSVTVGSVALMLIGGIGEEAGWRGILQPELERRFGLFKGTVLVGLIWGFWHLPSNLAGYNDARHPILQAALIFQIHTIAMSFVLAWLVKRSGSLWPAALCHAANNTLQSGPLFVPNGWWTDQLTGILASIAVGTIFGWLLMRRDSRIRGESGGEAGPISTLGPRTQGMNPSLLPKPRCL